MRGRLERAERGAAVVDLLNANGLERGVNGLRLIMMCEIPSNVLLADDFLQHVDGFSIGSNDLTQLTLGIDRDSGLVAGGFDERNPAVKKLLAEAIAACNRHGARERAGDAGIGAAIPGATESLKGHDPLLG